MPLPTLTWGDNSRRSLLICAAGAVVGLGVAGAGLFNAEGTTVRALPPEAAAVVNQRPIQRRDFTAQLEGEFNIPLGQATRAQKQKVLEEMIREELLVQRGLELDLAATDSDIRSALMSGMQTQVALDAMAEEPSEQTLRDYFSKHPDKYSSPGVLSVADLTPTNGDAAKLRQAAAALSGGASLNEVKATAGLRDSGLLQGDEYYFVVALRLGEPLLARLRNLKPGQFVVGQAPDGLAHLVVVQKNQPPVAQSFEEVKASVLADYRKDRIGRLLAAETTYLRKRSDILVAADLR